MILVHFTFNNFFEYLIIVEQLKTKSIWLFNPDEFILTCQFILTCPYNFTPEHAIRRIENLCKPLNIQFTKTIEVTEDTE